MKKIIDETAFLEELDTFRVEVKGNIRIEDVVEAMRRSVKIVLDKHTRSLPEKSVEDYITTLERYGCPKELSESLAIGLMEDK